MKLNTGSKLHGLSEEKTEKTVEERIYQYEMEKPENRMLGSKKEYLILKNLGKLPEYKNLIKGIRDSLYDWRLNGITNVQIVEDKNFSRIKKRTWGCLLNFSDRLLDIPSIEAAAIEVDSGRSVYSHLNSQKKESNLTNKEVRTQIRNNFEILDTKLSLMENNFPAPNDRKYYFHEMLDRGVSVCAEIERKYKKHSQWLDFWVEFDEADEGGKKAIGQRGLERGMMTAGELADLSKETNASKDADEVSDLVEELWRAESRMADIKIVRKGGSMKDDLGSQRRCREIKRSYDRLVAPIQTAKWSVQTFEQQMVFVYEDMLQMLDWNYDNYGRNNEDFKLQIANTLVKIFDVSKKFS